MDNRQRITEEAALMFHMYGIRAVTMDMLASRLRISKRTIYEIFRDKDELLTGVLRWAGKKQKELISKVFSDSENVIEAIFRFFEIMDDHYSRVSPAFKLDLKNYHQDLMRGLREADELPFYNDNAEIIGRGVEEGVFRSEIDIAITNKCLFEMMRMLIDFDGNDDDDPEWKDIFRDFYINYLRGISTSEGLNLIDFYDKRQEVTNQNKSKK
ncbi:MAG: TetR/AcrR family transcriptional regulator [Bacteroidales bacterium]|nr:TetR/AcrR family transcriptional regulator [Bacteroidales bacterium]